MNGCRQLPARPRALQQHGGSNPQLPLYVSADYLRRDRLDARTRSKVRTGAGVTPSLELYDSKSLPSQRLSASFPIARRLFRAYEVAARRDVRSTPPSRCGTPGAARKILLLYGHFAITIGPKRQTTKPADAGTSLGTAIARVRRDSLPTISERKGRVMADDREVLTVKEVCDLLRVHPATLYKLAREGKIPSFRIVSEWRFRKDAILRWMAEKSAHAQQVRVAVNSRVNGEGQHRRMAGAEGRRR